MTAKLSKFDTMDFSQKLYGSKWMREDFFDLIKSSTAQFDAKTSMTSIHSALENPYFNLFYFHLTIFQLFTLGRSMTLLLNVEPVTQTLCDVLGIENSPMNKLFFVNRNCGESQKTPMPGSNDLVFAKGKLKTIFAPNNWHIAFAIVTFVTKMCGLVLAQPETIKNLIIMRHICCTKCKIVMANNIIECEMEFAYSKTKPVTK